MKNKDYRSDWKELISEEEAQRYYKGMYSNEMSHANHVFDYIYSDEMQGISQQNMSAYWKAMNSAIFFAACATFHAGFVAGVRAERKRRNKVINN